MRILFCLVLALLAFPMGLHAKEVPIRDFFRDAEFESIRLSPDGEHFSVVIPQEDRTILAVLRTSDRKVIGKWDYGENRHFYGVQWANNKRLLFRVAFKLGRYDFEVSKGNLYASNIDGTGRMDIPNGEYYSIVDMTPEDPDTVLVQRSVEMTFLFKLNVNNGRIITLDSVPIDSGGFVLDQNRKPRYAIGAMEDGSIVTYRKDDEKWKLVHESNEKTRVYRPIGMDADNKHVFLLRDENGKPSQLFRLNPESGKETLISSSDAVDPSEMLVSSDEKTLLAVGYDDETPLWDFVNNTHPESKIYMGLIKAFPGKAISFNGTTTDGRLFAFSTYSDTATPEAYIFDSKTGKATYLLSSADWLKEADMSPMRAVKVKTRDGATIYGYLTVPRGSSGKNLPLIVNPHGGPHGVRDDWGFNPEVQLFANRGYAVLQMNYRGSGGYGDAYERVGYKKWGTLMQDDLTDSVKQLIANGTVDKDRICIYGASYGGYAALMSVVKEPDLYRCTVGYVGVYDFEIQRSRSDTSESNFGMSYLNEVLPSTAPERMAQSPAYHVDRIKVPVMLVHGKKDVRVPIKNMDFLISQMKKAGKAPEVVVVQPKEAHGFRNVDNNVDLYTKMLAFFDKYIGPNAKSGTPAPAAQ